MDKSPSLEKSILATLTYYNALGNFPLTAVEIYKYLTNYQVPEYIEKSSDQNDNKTKFSLNQVFDCLQNNQYLKNFCGQKNGFYFIKNKEADIKLRLHRQKIADQKWKKLKKIAKWIQLIPYVKTVVVGGSLAINNTKEESDLDLIIIAKKGRIWIVRTFISGLVQLIGQRRHGQKIKNKICLSHYLSECSLEFQIKNCSNAHLLSHMVPILNQSHAQKFIQANNIWAKQYLLQGLPQKIYNLKTIKPNKTILKLANLTEAILNNNLGNMIEKKLGQMQKQRILKKTDYNLIAFDFNQLKNKKNQPHLCLSEKMLTFHYPISRNLEIQKEYNLQLKKTGLINV